MEIARPVKSALVILASVIVAIGVTGCTPNPAGDVAVANGLVSRLVDLSAETDADFYASADDWVIVHFESNPEYTVDEAFQELESTEYIADDALQDEGLGQIDGNEIGQDSYDIYFVGFDRDPMWEALAPIFADASLQWTSVELYDGLEDPDPITFSSGR